MDQEAYPPIDQGQQEAVGDGDGSKGAAGLKPIRRRNRMINSCLECRKRKLKCSKTSPACMNCLKAGRDCLYIGPRLDEASQMRLAEIKEKQGSLERQLERDVARSTTSKSALQQRFLADEVEDGSDEERDLESTQLAALDMTYEDDADATDEMIDLGVQIGRMRLTERIGGLSRPRIAEEITKGLQKGPARLGEGFQPGAPPAGVGNGSGRMGMPSTPGLDAMSDHGSDGSIPDYLRPSAEYIAPTSGFFFGQVVESPSIMSFLPNKAAADRLMAQYYRAVHPIIPCAHRPSLEKAYDSFWEEIAHGYEPRASTQAVIFAAMMSAAISMEEDVVLKELGSLNKASWVASLRMGTETALAKANFLKTTRVETMQAFVMYMLPLCRAEVSRAHAVLLATAVRMAECMGLHRDGEAYGLSPLETHVRRLIWHQLCFLDIRTCEAQGPKPVIRREDYDTKFPLNVNDDELSHATVPPEPQDRFTTPTLALIRFEVNEMFRIIWMDRRRLENRKTTLTAVLTKIENFRRRMSEKYDHLLDVGNPLQRYTKTVLYLLTYRLYPAVLHPYQHNAANPMPPRLSSLHITSAVMSTELAIQLETNQWFSLWKWYLGAYTQYQIALMLATEVYYHPDCREADRIWICLDYVFGTDRRLPPEAKGVQILAEIAAKTTVYMRRRKMRAPKTVTKAQPNSIATAGAEKQTTPANVREDYAQQLQQQDQIHQIRHRSQGQIHGQQQHLYQHPVMPMEYRPPNQQPTPPYQDFNAALHSSHSHPSTSQPDYHTQQFTSIPPQQQQQQQHPELPATISQPQAPAQPMHQQQQQQQQQLQQPPMVFAGVSDGQALWTYPTTGQSPESDPGSMSVGAMGGGVHGGGQMDMAATGNIMDGLDWDTINALFPNDPQTGMLSIQGYSDPTFDILNWGTA